MSSHRHPHHQSAIYMLPVTYPSDVWDADTWSLNFNGTKRELGHTNKPSGRAGLVDSAHYVIITFGNTLGGNVVGGPANRALGTDINCSFCRFSLSFQLNPLMWRAWKACRCPCRVRWRPAPVTRSTWCCGSGTASEFLCIGELKRIIVVTRRLHCGGSFPVIGRYFLHYD